MKNVSIYAVWETIFKVTHQFRQYCVLYNTSITSIAGWRILEFPALCALQY